MEEKINAFESKVAQVLERMIEARVVMETKITEVLASMASVMDTISHLRWKLFASGAVVGWLISSLTIAFFTLFFTMQVQPFWEKQEVHYKWVKTVGDAEMCLDFADIGEYERESKDLLVKFILGYGCPQELYLKVQEELRDASK